MRTRTDHILENWKISTNPNGKIWKKNKSFRDTEILKIIQDIEINEKLGNITT